MAHLKILALPCNHLLDTGDPYPLCRLLAHQNGFYVCQIANPNLSGETRRFSVKPRRIKPLTGEVVEFDVEQVVHEDVETQWLDRDEQCPAGYQWLDRDEQCPAGYDWETVEAKTQWYFAELRARFEGGGAVD